LKAGVYHNGILAGILEKRPDGTYSFEYDEVYLQNDKNPSISLTLPRSTNTHESEKLFSFFFGLLAEGINKNIQRQIM